MHTAQGDAAGVLPQQAGGGGHRCPGRYGRKAQGGALVDLGGGDVGVAPLQRHLHQTLGGGRYTNP